MSTEAIFLGAAGLVAGASLFVIVWYVFQLIAGWKVFDKMGEPGWKSLIPFYNGYVLYQHIWSVSVYWIYLICVIATYGLNQITADGGNFFLSLISAVVGVISFVISIIECNKLSKAFGHGIGYTIGLIFLRPIFYLILGFGSSEYLGNSSEY